MSEDKIEIEASGFFDRKGNKVSKGDKMKKNTERNMTLIYVDDKGKVLNTWNIKKSILPSWLTTTLAVISVALFFTNLIYFSNFN